MKANFQFSIINYQLDRGFTLIEMLVTIAIIAIVSGVVIVGINPAKRIADAQDSRARQDVRAVASAIEACLSWADPSPTAGNLSTNDVRACGDATVGPTNQLVGTPASPCVPTTNTACGGPFSRAVPASVSISNTGVAGGYACANEQGAPGNWWKYSTQTGSVSGPNAASGCP